MKLNKTIKVTTISPEGKYVETFRRIGDVEICAKVNGMALIISFERGIRKISETKEYFKQLKKKAKTVKEKECINDIIAIKHIELDIFKNYFKYELKLDEWYELNDSINKYYKYKLDELSELKEEK